MLPNVIKLRLTSDYRFYFKKLILCSTTQTHLRDSCTETSKMGKWEQTGGEKREERRLARDTALQLRAHYETQHGEGRNQVVLALASTGRSEEIQ